MNNDKPTERAPLLSQEAVRKMILPYKDTGVHATTYRFGIEAGRDFYEAKITSGELRVVKKVSGETKGNSDGSWLHCSGCNEVWSTNAYKHCPGCGNPIQPNASEPVKASE